MNLQAPTSTTLQAPALPGTWKLAAGRAITLRPRQDGVVRIAHGRVWATYDGPHEGSRLGLGDRVVGAGGELAVRAGQRLVIEPWDRGAPAYFSWEQPQVQLQPAAGTAEVRQSVRELRLALVQAGQATARLAGGLVRLGVGSLTPRRAPAPCGNV